MPVPNHPLGLAVKAPKIPSSMTSKRSYEASEGNDGAQQPASKRNKNNKARDHQNAHIDPTWGQKYVFSSAAGSTTVPVDPELDFEDDGDAMAYLKSVR